MKRLLPRSARFAPLLLIVLAGCAASRPVGPTEDARVRSEDLAWRRKAIPAPPFYLDYRTGNGTRWRIVTPFFWKVEGQERTTAIYGPVYQRTELNGDQRRRSILMPWIFSRETDKTGYSYWGVLFRFIGYEKQVFDGKERSRLWLLFNFPVELG